jgi:hypothetical protein
MPDVSLSDAAASSEPSDISSPTETPTHFDHLILRASDIDETIAVGAVPSSVILGREEFHNLFLTAFTVSHNLTGLQSLKIGEEREGAAKACSYAVYDSIMEIPSLHFMLQPQNKWFERAIAIGAFTIPTAIAVRAELKLRRLPATATNFSPSTRVKGEDGLTPEQAASLGAA